MQKLYRSQLMNINYSARVGQQIPQYCANACIVQISCVTEYSILPIHLVNLAARFQGQSANRSNNRK